MLTDEELKNIGVVKNQTTISDDELKNLEIIRFGQSNYYYVNPVANHYRNTEIKINKSEKPITYQSLMKKIFELGRKQGFEEGIDEATGLSYENKSIKLLREAIEKVTFKEYKKKQQKIYNP
jgi:hypothetical protein